MDVDCLLQKGTTMDFLEMSSLLSSPSPLSNLSISKQKDSEDITSDTSIAIIEDDWQVVSNVSKHKSHQKGIKKSPITISQPSVGKKTNSSSSFNGKGDGLNGNKREHLLKTDNLIHKSGVDTELHYYPPPVNNNCNEDSAPAVKVSEFMQLLGSEKLKLESELNSSGANRLTVQRRGITNTGCSCFRNAVLQVFISMDPFLNYLLTSLETVNILPVHLTSLSVTDYSIAPYWLEFLALVSQFSHLETPLKGQQSKNETVISTRATVLNANIFIPRLIRAFQLSVATGNRTKPHQEDAMEFLTFVLDSLHEEIIRIQHTNAKKGCEGAAPADIDSAANVTNAIANQAPEDEWSVVTKPKHCKGKNLVVDDSSRLAAENLVASTVISRFFHGTLRSEVIYKAKKVRSITFQRFHCLTLDVLDKGKKSRTSVQQCLELYFKEEVVVENEIHKQLRLEHLPEVLVLQLARFTFDSSRGHPIKIQTAVEFPESLEVPERFRSPPDLPTAARSASSVRYELRSVVLHHGVKATGGHYSAHCKDSLSDIVSEGLDPLKRFPYNSTTYPHWRNFNDTKVRVISRDELLSATDSVYLLFYLRQSGER